MYLVSIYFDEKADQRIRNMIKQVAEKTGNSYMLDGNVPPHITVSAFETKDEELAVEVVNKVAKKLSRGELQWASIGQFLPYVIYVAPVLNQYLHGLSEAFYGELAEYEQIKISPYYRPFQWLPHTTIGKKLSKEEMKLAFEVLQANFGMFQGSVVKVGLAKTNPYQDIISFEL